MKFIAGLRVWVNGVMGKTSQVFPRFSGSANRRVDLHLPLIASILGRRHGALKSLADRRRCGAKTAKPLLERNRSAVGKTKAPLVAGGPQQLTPPTIFSPSLNEPLHGGNVPVTRRACVGLALLSLRVSSRLPKPPLLPARPIYALKQTVCRPAASFKSLYPKGRNGLR